jgi:hypothetical protein
LLPKTFRPFVGGFWWTLAHFLRFCSGTSKHKAEKIYWLVRT